MSDIVTFQPVYLVEISVSWYACSNTGFANMGDILLLEGLPVAVLHDWCNKGLGMYSVWDNVYKRTIAANLKE